MPQTMVCDAQQLCTLPVFAGCPPALRHTPTYIRGVRQAITRLHGLGFLGGKFELHQYPACQRSGCGVLQPIFSTQHRQDTRPHTLVAHQIASDPTHASDIPPSVLCCIRGALSARSRALKPTFHQRSPFPCVTESGSCAGACCEPTHRLL